jgi:hypothetical protein
VLTIRNPCFSIRRESVTLHSAFMFSMILRIRSDYFPKQLVFRRKSQKICYKLKFKPFENISMGLPRSFSQYIDTQRTPHLRVISNLYIHIYNISFFLICIFTPKVFWEFHMDGEPSRQVNKQSSSGYSLLSLHFDPEDGDITASIYCTLETCRPR